MTVFEPTPATALTAGVKRERMQKLRWFHSLDLGDEVVTPGLKPRERLEFQAEHVFKHSVSGMSVLDIGCWDGFFSFEARRRGARRVLATDRYVWDGPGWGDKQAFELARECIAPDVEVRVIDFDDMSPGTVGSFDTVLFLGVLYHLKHPYAAIQRAASMADKVLVVETHVDVRLPDEPPAMVFYPFNELNKDPSNWWGPNASCVSAMLQTCGFSKVEIDHEYHWPGSQRCLVHAIR